MAVAQALMELDVSDYPVDSGGVYWLSTFAEKNPVDTRPQVFLYFTIFYRYYKQSPNAFSFRCIRYLHLLPCARTQRIAAPGGQNSRLRLRRNRLESASRGFTPS